jgi:glutamate synthase (NADPH/NADH) small chain
VRQLGLAHEDAPGLLAATDYIRELRQADDLRQLPLADRCLVIGAGNTAIDMAVQMARLGARDVNLVYRRARPTWAPPATNRTSPRPIRCACTPGPNPMPCCSMTQARCAACASCAPSWSTAACDTGETFELAADAIFKAIGHASTTPASATRWPRNWPATASASRR